MSGGSFNYLCYKSADELFAAEADLQHMADELAQIGYAPDAAAETQELLLDLRAFYNRATTRMRRLNNVWRAVEWWRSCDYSEEQVAEAVQQYQQGQ